MQIVSDKIDLKVETPKFLNCPIYYALYFGEGNIQFPRKFMFAKLISPCQTTRTKNFGDIGVSIHKYSILAHQSFV